MIVVQEEETYCLVTQTDHAHFAAELLSLFRLPDLIEHPRRRGLLRAVREHDNGWRESDVAPRVAAETGAPVGFRELDGPCRRELWTRACERFRSEDAYMALLITSHALELHRRHGSSPDWAEWMSELEATRTELFEEVSLSPDEAAADYAWLSIADQCSLAACERRRGDFEAGTMAGESLRGSSEGDELRLGPFPLAGSTTFRLACRRIPLRRYSSTVELGSALATARWQQRAISVSPL